MIIALGDVYSLLSRVDDARELMRATQAGARGEPGCLEYAFAEMLDDPGHFLVVQRWRDRAALEDHYRSAPFAAYQSQVSEMLVRDSQLTVHEVRESIEPLPAIPLDPRQDD